MEPAAEEASKVDPLEILRDAVGEGWSVDDVAGDTGTSSRDLAKLSGTSPLLPVARVAVSQGETVGSVS